MGDSDSIDAKVGSSVGNLPTKALIAAGLLLLLNLATQGAAYALRTWYLKSDPNAPNPFAYQAKAIESTLDCEEYGSVRSFFYRGWCGANEDHLRSLDLPAGELEETRTLFRKARSQ